MDGMEWMVTKVQECLFMHRTQEVDGSTGARRVKVIR